MFGMLRQQDVFKFCPNCKAQLEQAARRELKAETGLEVSELQYLGSLFEDYYYQDEIHSVVTAVYGAEAPKGAAVIVADDVSDYKFLAREDLKIDHIAFDN